tara:strand:+ start:1527 stop:2561 length:1035 start_codon:yes stop_codon:yes gene_type:complete
MQATLARLTQAFSNSNIKWSSIFVAAVFLFAVILGLSLGAVQLPIWNIVTGSADSLETTIFTQIRAPRVFLAAAVGASLAGAGAVLQGLFRNPLADPGLIGVSGGAALGAVAVIVFGAWLSVPPELAIYTMPVAAVFGALVVTGVLYLFANRFGQFRIVTVLLVGIAINALSSVGIGLFQYASDDAQLRTLIFWMMGSFGRAQWMTALPCIAMMILATLALVGRAEALDKLQLGEAEAFHLGVDVIYIKRQVVLLSAICVGAGVAVAGIIGFVGLVVPHIARFTLGVAHRPLILGSALLGATLMVSADLLARTAVLPAEIPVGLVTSALGAPFFLWLITKVTPR